MDLCLPLTPTHTPSLLQNIYLLTSYLTYHIDSSSPSLNFTIHFFQVHTRHIQLFPFLFSMLIQIPDLYIFVLLLNSPRNCATHWFVFSVHQLTETVPNTFINLLLIPIPSIFTLSLASILLCTRTINTIFQSFGATPIEYHKPFYYTVIVIFQHFH